MSSRFSALQLDDSLHCLEELKQLTNKRWQQAKIRESLWGFQIQVGTKWRAGLSEIALTEFEAAMGFEFPVVLKNYFLTMNGLDTPGINVRGSGGEPPNFGPIYYSYPDDLHEIKETIGWILEANHITLNDLPSKASRIFPIMSHRCLLIDDPNHRVLSMFGHDIIFWANSLSELLYREAFPKEYNVAAPDRRFDTEGIRFWLDQT